jgi:3-hydroxyisobutyrate dehydrogenase-like beta-hydroxyacid dehydrogenase
MKRSAAVLYPGEMGCAVARELVATGWDVCTHLSGPSLVCRGDAEAAAIATMASLEEAIATSDLVISLVPPAAAVEVAAGAAEAALRSGRRPLYLDANTVSPATVTSVSAAVAVAGLDCVDGAFIGSAAELGGRTRLYLSGPRASELTAILPGALHADSLGPDVGDASAFKLAFAGFNKGLVALFLEGMAAGGVSGRADELLRCLRDFYPGTVQTLERLLPSYPRHAARRADELDELAHWLSSEGRDPACAEAARDVLRRVAAIGLDGTRTWSFAEALDGLLAAEPDAGEPDGGGSATPKP